MNESAHGRLLGFELVGGSLPPDTEACFASVLRGVAWMGLPSGGSSVTIDLQLRM